MSCPRKLFLEDRKSVFREVRMQANLGLIFERIAKISCDGGRSVPKNLRARQDCMRTSREIYFRPKSQTSVGLKTTVSWTWHIPANALSFPLCPHHFLLFASIFIFENHATRGDIFCEQGWRRRESRDRARLLTLEFRTHCRVWVECVVGSRTYRGGFLQVVSSFLPSTKTNTQK